ncbi:protein kinase [Paucilactobacillus hokkaidonensis JCM 18461]|uniref:non-specific serine/threonine protein kinase n=2 Tax=Paucilactobacillus hokkaidonensis TaxID=1193095 RepID=A0A0A1GXB3_9LACO|nr:Stk1 family PASTA domain-containing Ser/Thr kinase [Paucilactobacillus hokkaidonensis]KRO09761.1 non-specific serine threonine protein kinase [Paucilactobacillus hokkaidonensis]BAP85573.1 protein kinase [Paucilactobacillus hokkaidonensis JCM 18461]
MTPGYTLNGRYRIKRSLGEGGMANVYLAHDLILDRDVSVKLLRLDLRDDPNTKRRFQREAMAATQLNDDHIVGVYDVGEDNGLQYLVMEYVAGTDLKTYINKHFPIPFQQIIDIMEQILSAVQEAHLHGIIHRDLKPQNVLINEQQQVKITDFGIAVAVSQNALTQTNTVMGSVHYLSPEQARGSMATKQSDIYSLGIILYELLTGKVPFEGETAVSIALKHFRDEMPSVREFDPRIPQALENVVLKATAKQPKERYSSAEAMALDLKTSLSASRAKESKFIPQQIDQGETKVLDAKGIEAASKKESSQEKQPVPAKKKKHKKWLWISIIALIFIGGALAVWMTPTRAVVPEVTGLTETKAKSKITSDDLKVGTIKRKSSDTIKTGYIISATPQAEHKVAKNTKVNLVVSTGQQKVKMGNYVGDQYTQVAKRLRLKGITVKKVSASSDDVDSGQIMSQSIKAGKRIKTYQATVTFKVSVGKKQVSIPDFTNKTTAEVQKFADDNDLQLTTSEQASSTVTEGNVISQSPDAGSKVSHGDTITVTTAKSAQNTSTVQISIPFDSSNNQTENRVQVYIEDANHKLTQEYQDLTISQATTINVPFTLDDGKSGSYKVIRGGKTIMSATNVQN